MYSDDVFKVEVTMMTKISQIFAQLPRRHCPYQIADIFA